MDLIEKRKQMGLTCLALAEKSGISLTSLTRVEQGLTKIDNFTLGNARKIANVLNVSLDTLYYLMSNIKPNHKRGNPLGSMSLKKKMEMEMKNEKQ